MTAPEQRETETFFLSTGGLLYTLFERIGLANRPIARAIILTAMAWLPLLILSAINGLATGNEVRVPFLQDYGVYGRIAVAIPLFVLAEISVGNRARDVLAEFITARLVREQDVPLFRSAVANASKQKDSVVAEVVIIGIVYAFIGVRSTIALSDPLTTWYHTGGGITVAGWYFIFVSLPIFQFLLIRWVWRLAVWTGLLWKISRLDLRLVAIHPDKTGGLGFLSLAQIPFGLVGFAGGFVISSYLINSMVYRGLPLTSATGIMVIYVILAVLVLIAPILVFTSKLVMLRAHGLLEYSDIGGKYARLFDDKWVKGLQREEETILGSADIQSLADLANSFEIVQNMRIVPADQKSITIMAGLAALPMLPVFFVALPFYEIIARVIGIFG